MTDSNEPDDGDDRDYEDDMSGSIPLGTLFGTLSELLDQLENLDLDAGESRSGNVRRGDATFDYNVNIGSINPAGESRRNRRQRDWHIEGKSDDHEYHVRIDEEDGEIVVFADLPAVSADDVDVATNDETGSLEIRVDGEVVESIPFDWVGATVTDVTFQNQILEVHVRPSDDDTDADVDSEDRNGDDEGGTAP